MLLKDYIIKNTCYKPTNIAMLLSNVLTTKFVAVSVD